ncbi:hypothetical protein [Bradyrhizobium genosp. P]|uniref:hypothetical protein n=1 Tax=Bradyrhizobium genosp. P TaxID=83641 RepID=UPI003CF8FC29
MAKNAKRKAGAKKTTAAAKAYAKKAPAYVAVAKKKKTKKAAKKATNADRSLGCCTIIYDDHSEQVPNVTQQQCTRLGIARGGTGLWNPGSCA